MQDLVNECEWFRVYDIIEALYQQLVRDPSGAAPKQCGADAHQEEPIEFLALPPGAPV